MPLTDIDIEEKTGARKLIDKFTYWGEHPNYPIADWQYEVANGDTRMGYWAWVWRKL
jgi:hypothetical protein